LDAESRSFILKNNSDRINDTQSRVCFAIKYDLVLGLFCLGIIQEMFLRAAVIQLTTGIEYHWPVRLAISPARKPALTDNSTITVSRTGWRVERRPEENASAKIGSDGPLAAIAKASKIQILLDHLTIAAVGWKVRGLPKKGYREPLAAARRLPAADFPNWFAHASHRAFRW
jgi:hypothetical protein